MSSPVAVITGSIARSAMRRYLNYSEADFEVFRPTGATRWTDGCEIWRGGGDHDDVGPTSACDVVRRRPVDIGPTGKRRWAYVADDVGPTSCRRVCVDWVLTLTKPYSP